LWYFDKHLTGPALYYWMWWVVMGYYALAIGAIQVRMFGIKGLFRGTFHDDCDAEATQADNCDVVLEGGGAGGGGGGGKGA
jgi:hypothetical protein